MAAMAKYDSGSIAKMLAYMLIIMKTQKEFKEPAWRLNDIVYRDKAAATRNKKWSQIDLLLYTCFLQGGQMRYPSINITTLPTLLILARGLCQGKHQA